MNPSLKMNKLLGNKENLSIERIRIPCNYDSSFLTHLQISSPTLVRTCIMNTFRKLIVLTFVSRRSNALYYYEKLIFSLNPE